MKSLETAALKKVCIYWIDINQSINNFPYFLFVFFLMLILQVESKIKHFYFFFALLKAGASSPQLDYIF